MRNARGNIRTQRVQCTNGSLHQNSKGGTATTQVKREQYSKSSPATRSSAKRYQNQASVVELSIYSENWSHGKATRRGISTTQRVGSGTSRPGSVNRVPTGRRYSTDSVLWYGSQKVPHSSPYSSVRQRAASAGSYRRRHVKHANNEIDYRDDDARSVCTNASTVVSQARSDSALITQLNKPHRPPERIGSTKGRNPNQQRTPSTKTNNGRSGSRSGYPSGFANVQEMVRRLRDSRLPVNANVLQNKSGLRELSIHGHQNSVDPVLAWSNLSRPTEKEWTRQLSTQQRNSEIASTISKSAATAFSIPDSTNCSISEVCSVSDINDNDTNNDNNQDNYGNNDTDYTSDSDEVVSVINLGKDTMEPIAITPFVPPEEDEDVFRYGSNYEKRTGQILNYYTDKETPVKAEHSGASRHDRIHQKVSRSIPSQSSFYRPVAASQMGFTKHWRSSTVPMPMQRKSLESSTKSMSGRIFMGRRIQQPQKIVPAYRPKPIQRRGRSFVQIHQPLTLMPRSNTSDYALHTYSLSTNSGEEDSGDEYQQTREVSLEQNMKNLQIVGTSLTKKQLSGTTKHHHTAYTTYGKELIGVTSTLGGLARDNNKTFPAANQDVLTQIQSISAPYSQHNSMQYLSNSHIATHLATSSIPQTGVTRDDLCVYNHVNPSPRNRTANPQLQPAQINIMPVDYSQTPQPDMIHQENILHSSQRFSMDGNLHSQLSINPNLNAINGLANSIDGQTNHVSGLTNTQTGQVMSSGIGFDEKEKQTWLKLPPDSLPDSSTFLNDSLYQQTNSEQYDLGYVNENDNDYDTNEKQYDEYDANNDPDYYKTENTMDDSDALIDYVNDVNEYGNTEDDGQIYDAGTDDNKSEGGQDSPDHKGKLSQVNFEGCDNEVNEDEHDHADET